MEILIKKSHLFSSKKRNYKRLSFLLQLRVSSFKIIREKESRENLPTSFSYLRRRLPNICDWGLLVLLIFWSESWFSASSVLFLYPKTFDSPEASARSSFSAPRSVLTETWQCEKKYEQNKYIKRGKKMCITGRWRSCCTIESLLVYAFSWCISILYTIHVRIRSWFLCRFHWCIIVLS